MSDHSNHTPQLHPIKHEHPLNTPEHKVFIAEQDKKNTTLLLIYMAIVK